MNHSPDQGQHLSREGQERVAEAARHHTVHDVGGQRIARVYATALLNAAEKQGKAEEVLDELDSLVSDLFQADPQLEAFLASGAIGRHQKESLIRSAFQGRASEAFLNFLLVLNDHERLDMLRSILGEVQELRNQRVGRLRIQVQSAVPLPDDQRDRLVQQLREKFQKEPVLETRVDPELLGGLVVQVGDWVYDGSVRTQLENIRNQIIERSSYEIQSGRNRFSAPDGN